MKGRPIKKASDEIENLIQKSRGLVCDKCGGMFASDYELDHHDKTDH